MASTITIFLTCQLVFQCIPGKEKVTLECRMLDVPEVIYKESVNKDAKEACAALPKTMPASKSIITSSL